MSKTYFVYPLASQRNGTLHTGVTDDLARRVGEHKDGLVPGFTQKYGIKILVWYETFSDVPAAIRRETRLKKSTRRRKLDLIESVNPQWLDLAEGL